MDLTKYNKHISSCINDDTCSLKLYIPHQHKVKQSLQKLDHMAANWQQYIQQPKLQQLQQQSKIKELLLLSKLRQQQNDDNFSG